MFRKKPAALPEINKMFLQIILKYLLYCVILFKLVLLISYLKKLIKKKIKERIPGSKEVHVRNTLRLKTSAE